jgi:membrane associated rhomboid family serine protease
MPPVVLNLLIANIAMYIAQSMIGDRLILSFALWPLGDYDANVGFAPWQLVTYAFLHSPDNVTHLLLNMFAIYMFGRDVEMQMGSKRFAILYGASILAAGLAQLLVTSMRLDQVIAPTLGASGGVFGVLLAFGALFPKRRVMLLIPPIPMPAWVLVSGYAVIELLNGVYRTSSGVAHFAHLGGMVGAGIVLLIYHQRSRPRPRFPR